MVWEHMETDGLAAPLPEAKAQWVAGELSQLAGMEVYSHSIVATQGTVLFLGRQPRQKILGILATANSPVRGFTGETRRVTMDGRELSLAVAPTTAGNAAVLRQVLPFLVPQPLGLRKSVGCGDRLGLATPGHIRAVRNSAMAPILAQQSMRENARTGRTPQGVMDDATWGAFQEGWRDGFGADADHLKTTADIDACAAAEYTFYTIDPGEHVNNSADTASSPELQEKIEDLPWEALDTNPADLVRRLTSKPVELDDFGLTLDREQVLPAAVKYGGAVAHTARLFRHLVQVMGDRPFELEVSVDETASPTTLAEHIYIANELKRLDVEWVSLAPRYVGEFEKGVDYIGDLGEFERSFTGHVAVARAFGPYKLSLHSGSDKFRIYPLVARMGGELVHLKTAGTSYLEALRAVALLDPSLFREIVAFAVQCYPSDRATYHVSAQVASIPDVSAQPDDQLPTLLDDFHGREVLHVTFGSVLNHPDLREPLFDTLRDGEETYCQLLEEHFNRHLDPFA
jgi:hypothetical protein